MILEKECLHSEIPTGTQQQEDDKVSRGVGSGEESMVSVPDAAAERWVTVKGKCLQGKPARERGRTPPNPILNRSLPELASSLLTTGSSGTRPPLECKYFPVFPRMSWELEALASDFRACQFVFRAQEGLLGGWDMGLTCGYYPAGLRECCAQHPPPRWGGGCNSYKWASSVQETQGPTGVRTEPQLSPCPGVLGLRARHPGTYMGAELLG